MGEKTASSRCTPQGPNAAPYSDESLNERCVHSRAVSSRVTSSGNSASSVRTRPDPPSVSPASIHDDSSPSHRRSSRSTSSSASRRIWSSSTIVSSSYALNAISALNPADATTHDGFAIGAPDADRTIDATSSPLRRCQFSGEIPSGQRSSQRGLSSAPDSHGCASNTSPLARCRARRRSKKARPLTAPFDQLRGHVDTAAHALRERVAEHRWLRDRRRAATTPERCMEVGPALVVHVGDEPARVVLRRRARA